MEEFKENFKYIENKIFEVSKRFSSKEMFKEIKSPENLDLYGLKSTW